MTSPPPPHDLRSEAVVLLSVILSPERSGRVRKILGAGGAFFWVVHREIWMACCSLSEAKKPIDAASVRRHLHDRGVKTVGGVGSYLGDMLNFATYATGPSLTHHAQSIHDLWQRRLVIAAAHQLAAEGYGPVTEDWHARATDRLRELIGPQAAA